MKSITPEMVWFEIAAALRFGVRAFKFVSLVGGVPPLATIVSANVKFARSITGNRP
jgi:hypothetical protein